MGRLELPASCSQSKRATNCATPGYRIFRCGQTCGQRRFLTSYRRGRKCCQPKCPKAFQVFRGLWTEPGLHAPKPGAIPTSLYPDIHFSAIIPRRREKSKIFLSVVIYVVKAAFIPLSAIGGNPANTGVTRLCGVSPCLVSDSATALPKQARYQLR